MRNFTLVGVISVLAISILLGFFMRQAADQEIKAYGQGKNRELAGMLSNTVWKQHEAYFHAAASMQAEALRASPESIRIRDAIGTGILGVEKIGINLYAPNGSVLFSTDTSLLGMKQPVTAGLREALRGEISSGIISTDTLYYPGDPAVASRKGREILFSFVPIRDTASDDGKVVGVFEIRSDVTAFMQATEQTRNMILGGIVLSMLLVYTVLFFHLKRANNIIQIQFDQKRKDEERIRHVAYHDSLTGLPNREMFQNRLTAAMSRAKRNDSLLAILFMDLDRFKQVNDSLGHSAGDIMLKEISRRLLLCLRPYDTVARQGGDEFTMILEGIRHVDEVAIIVERILEAVNEPIRIQQDEVVTSASIGVTIYPFDDVEIEHLMSNADAAMYRAKEGGRNNYVFYTADMNTSNTDKLAMERKLRQALNEDEYHLYYQPIVDLRTGTVFASEALLRWDSKEYGLVSPGRFIPILEDSGMIGIVGEWVLKTACRKNREWQEMGYPPIQVSVNVSLYQFRQMNFVDTVREALDEVGLDPKYLKLELTESMLMDSTDASVRKLEALRALGVSIAADDFGTGYSSLSYLKRLPIDTLKIDRSFVTDVHKSSDSAAIVTAIIALAYSLRLNVIAEGVEEIQEMNFISALGCHLIQGFYFSKPLTESDFIALLADPGILQEKLNAIRMRNQSAFAS